MTAGQVTRFEKHRWCIRLGPLVWIWMRRPMRGGTEHLMTFSWLSGSPFQ